jgi:hypothetical protein
MCCCSLKESYFNWRICYFFLVLTATQIGVNAIDDYTKFFAFIAAVSIAFLTSFNLIDKSNNTRMLGDYLMLQLFGIIKEK